jgi:hypothetical protein
VPGTLVEQADSSRQSSSDATRGRGSVEAAENAESGSDSDSGAAADSEEQGGGASSGTRGGHSNRGPQSRQVTDETRKADGQRMLLQVTRADAAAKAAAAAAAAAAAKADSATAAAGAAGAVSVSVNGAIMRGAGSLRVSTAIASRRAASLSLTRRMGSPMSPPAGVPPKIARFAASSPTNNPQ